MDSTTIILIINFVLQILQMLDHSLMQRLKKSSCWGINLELTNVSEKKDIEKKDNNNNNNNTPKFNSNNDLQKILELLNKDKKNDDIKIDIKDKI